MSPTPRFMHQFCKEFTCTQYNCFTAFQKLIIMTSDEHLQIDTYTEDTRRTCTPEVAFCNNRKRFTFDCHAQPVK
ncbi:hypothetical protein T10_7911 [Trichinella papuae]|uniref:Uncharacterized protein n=1 Tax=Trichinella papuae TaxID=268474 RepID=A0A0V1N7D3_9BILA|nr:hypothetical protein T10_7911 [Trichinella papuae]